MEPRTLFVDIETTGLPPQMEVPGKRPGTTKKEQVPYETDYMRYPHIVEIAWCIDDGDINQFIINQEGRDVPKEASDIHTITTEIANQSPHYFEKIMPDFIQAARDCHIVVGHGLYFDTSIIKANILRSILVKFGVNPPHDHAHFVDITEGLHKFKRIDTMRKTAKMMKKWPTLMELHMKIFNRGFEHHRAGNDVKALRDCYGWLLRKGIVPTYEELQEKAKEAAEEVNE